jgi:phenylacetate-CoA ligase
MLRTLHRLTFSAPARPIFDGLTRRRYRYAYHELMRTQWLSREDIARLQVQGLQRLLAHAYEYSPLHHERLRAAGWSPGSAVDFQLLRDLPPLEREDLQDRLDEVATVSRFAFPRVDTVTTGGTTTGQPLEMFNEGLASDRKGAARQRTNRWAGHRPGERICFFGGAALPARSPLLQRTWDSLKGAKTVPHWDVSGRALEAAVRRINAFRPRLLMCYPSTLNVLCCHLEERGLRLRIGALLVSGEMLTDAGRERAERVLGLPVYQAYGSCELGDAASTCPDCGALHVHDENVILETEAGTGALLATDLTNRATPLIRYRIGDLGQVSDEPAACGRGLRSLSRVQGRTVDVIEMADGRKVTLFALIVLLRHFPHVRAWQARQDQPGQLQLLVQGLTPKDEADMRARITANIPGLALDIIPVDSIPATPAGKRPLFVGGHAFAGQRRTRPD